MAVELEKFRPDSLVGCNLYLFQKNTGKFILYKRNEIQVTFSDIERLMSNNIHSLYVEVNNAKIIKDYLEDNLWHYLENRKNSLDKRSQLMYECASYRAKEVLKTPHWGDNIQRSKAIVENMVNFILSETGALPSLMQMMSHHYDTYTHSVNVCAFCLALAKYTGEQSIKILIQIGLGALLHDVGKCKVPEEILSKKGPLNQEEREVFERHPLMGADLLEKSMNLSTYTRAIITQHHEKGNGKGYPFGKEGRQIHPYAKMASIVNMFDAITTSGSNGEPFRAFPAFLIMKEKITDNLEEYYFKKFAELLKN